MTNPEGSLPPYAAALLHEIDVVLPPATSPGDYMSIDFGAAHLLDEKIASLAGSAPADVVACIQVARERAYDAAMKTDFPDSSKWMEDVI
jgi:hypothetical protein